MSETPLESVQGWTDDLVGLMRASWVTTAEQLVGIASTSSGMQSIAEQLHTDLGRAKSLVGAARARLPEATRQELEQPVDTSDFGLGVLLPER
jgi:hypothetical protein